MTISEQNRNQIEACQKKICELSDEIERQQEEILKLHGKTETCPHCNREGRFEIGHSFTKGAIYTKCIVCRGIGKVTKERIKEYQKEGAQFVYLSDMK